MKPLSEYPRPQLIRDSYLSLNGIWEYAIRDNSEFPDKYDGDVLVPYSIETPKSGVNKVLQPNQYLFYRLKLDLAPEFNKDKVILHFGAVDQIAKVYINRQLVCKHIGGFLPFKVDIKPYLTFKEDILEVVVQDFTDESYYSRGKQRLKRGGIWYSPQSGIYMPVWLEAVSKHYIECVKITPSISAKNVKIYVKSATKSLRMTQNGQVFDLKPNEENIIPIKDVRLWNLDDPYLYEFTLESDDDKVASYFAMREISMVKDEHGHQRICLNGEPIFLKGVLDQGYYQDGFLTPNSDEDYINDINLIKDLGFNCVRKHIKIESLRWYYHCDRLGLLVWQDFVNGGRHYKLPTIVFPLITNVMHKDSNYSYFSRKDEIGREQAIEEFKATIDLLYNSPSIMLWTIFNEGWGQFNSVPIYEMCKQLDNTRLYDHASGWHDQGVSETKSLHVYFKRVKMPKEKKVKDRAIILSECGGYNLKIEGHAFSKKNFGYKQCKDEEELIKNYETLIEKDILMNIPKGLSAFIYTQLSDVEDEVNGFVTYDRQIVKVDKARIKALNDKARY